MASPPKPRIFITHSWNDIEIARRLYNDLKEIGFELWFDDKTLRAGHRMAEEINRGLEWCDVYIPVLSRAALASEWCWEEINAAISLSNRQGRGRRPQIIPALTEDCDVPALLASRLYINFKDRYDVALRELLVKGLWFIPERLPNDLQPEKLAPPVNVWQDSPLSTAKTNSLRTTIKDSVYF